MDSSHCATSYVKGSRYCIEDRTLVGERRLQPPQKSVELEQMLYTDNSRDKVYHNIVRQQALRNVSAGEAFHVNYGSAYMFLQ